MAGVVFKKRDAEARESSHPIPIKIAICFSIMRAEGPVAGGSRAFPLVSDTGKWARR